MAQKSEPEVKLQSPKKALILSAVLPGAGQIYNKKLWKAPIIWGLGTFLIFQYSKFDTEYQCYLRVLDDEEHTTCSDSENKYGIANLETSQIQDRKDIVKRNRDLQVILLLLTYVVNIVDANVDAHLNEFDIGDNASATIDPTVMPYQINGYSKNAVGLNINLKF